MNQERDRDRDLPAGEAAIDSAEQAMTRVLQAEHDASQAIAQCAQEASDILQSAQDRAHRISSRADERITRMNMRCRSHVEQELRALERASHEAEQAETTRAPDPGQLAAVARQLALELTTDYQTVVPQQEQPE